jgi:hypothetical protein
MYQFFHEVDMELVSSRLNIGFRIKLVGFIYYYYFFFHIEINDTEYSLNKFNTIIELSTL